STSLTKTILLVKTSSPLIILVWSAGFSLVFILIIIIRMIKNISHYFSSRKKEGELYPKL
ncbi:MAG: hypothetical protein ACXAD7_16985, partial [Candidatus Kariarchaeaceae archaeon]